MPPHLRPRSHMWAKPELGSSGPEIEHGPRHVRISPLIGADTVGMAEPEQCRELLCICKVFGADCRGHRGESIPLDKSAGSRGVDLYKWRAAEATREEHDVSR